MDSLFLRRPRLHYPLELSLLPRLDLGLVVQVVRVVRNVLQSIGILPLRRVLTLLDLPQIRLDDQFLSLSRKPQSSPTSS